MSEIAVDTTGARGVDDPAILLLDHVRIRGLRDLVCTTHMDCHNDVPLIISHVGESFVSKDASIIDQDVDSAVVVYSGLDYSVSVLNRRFVADCSASELLDLLYDCVGID